MVAGASVESAIQPAAVRIGAAGIRMLCAKRRVLESVAEGSRVKEHIRLLLVEDHALVREAAAQDAGQRLLNLFVGGLRRAIDERFRAEDDPAQIGRASCRERV